MNYMSTHSESIDAFATVLLPKTDEYSPRKKGPMTDDDDDLFLWKWLGNCNEGRKEFSYQRMMDRRDKLNKGNV